jgi:hypothetical protein
MEILKYNLKEMIRNEMDYIPETISESMLHKINSDQSKTKEDFLKKFMSENKDLLELYVLNENTKFQKKTYKLIQIVSIIVAISVVVSTILFLYLIF